ncbi:MAG: NAD(P)-dependent oxidoreductase [Actinophytocola sp.]|uniref:NAD(P)-dependent oxidoreductase n=1 Tax=Actinophytocola sp. TaxID=1872138 RepID=UPI0013253E31|nr:NAD(P)-dependent oxidoreductase [Actinophytocola sp.]MPZ86166.1 NAD(P)-dependent oxidoreductase [Actinophytocola sp.]
MHTIAFLGLGHMGLPMAGRLVAAGYEVTVWNRTRAKAVAVPGARVADTPAKAVAGVDVVLTMLADPAAVDAVVFGPDGVAGAIRPGTVLVEMSTIGPTAVAGLARGLPEGVGLVDAPVGGSTGAAGRGELTVFTGGADADVAAVTPVLERLGTVLRCGGPGAGAAAKLVRITAMVSGVTLLGELRAIGAALAVPAELTERLLANGPLAALVERSKGTDSHFAVELAAKDLGLAVEHADAPIARAALERIRSTLPRISGRDVGALANPPE